MNRDFRGGTLLIDGYNVLHAVKTYERILERSLQEAREAIKQDCLDLLQSRSDIRRIVLVFDGRSGFIGNGGKTGRLEIIFTESGEDADDRLVDLLESGAGRTPVFVVSNDNYVSNHARVYHGHNLSAGDFYRLFGRPAADGKSGASNPPEKKISPALARTITEEYRKYLGIRP